MTIIMILFKLIMMLLLFYPLWPCNTIVHQIGQERICFIVIWMSVSIIISYWLLIIIQWVGWWWHSSIVDIIIVIIKMLFSTIMNRKHRLILMVRLWWALLRYILILLLLFELIQKTQQPLLLLMPHQCQSMLHIPYHLPIPTLMLLFFLLLTLAINGNISPLIMTIYNFKIWNSIE